MYNGQLKPLLWLGSSRDDLKELFSGADRKEATVKVAKSRGNVFRDIGFAEREAANLRLRASLMVEIEKWIHREGLTQADAARKLGVTQPRISDLVRGRMDLFSVDGLVEMLGRAGLTVRLRVMKKTAA